MRIIFTDPPECEHPTQDNKEGNLVVGKGDYIIKNDSLRYMVIELLGTGTFGQVFRCISNYGDEVAIKVVKSANKYYQCEINEIRILKKLKDLKNNSHFVELYDAFIYKQHLCIVLELLGKNMYEYSKIMRFRGMDFVSVRKILKQVLEGICKLHSLGIVHGDLKPENILISDLIDLNVKTIDFGSSSTRAISSVFYIQSRFYRAPEVILGIPYSSAIDIWSFGCIAYELLMGHPLFPGCDNKDQIHRIHEFFPSGIPPFMLDHGIHTHEYFEKENNYFSRENSNKFTLNIAMNRVFSKFGMCVESELFIDFFLNALNLSYLERSSPQILLKHGFMTYQVGDMFFHDRDRSSGTKIPVPDNDPRKMSMYNVEDVDYDNFYIKQRKGSVFQPNDENKNNW